MRDYPGDFAVVGAAGALSAFIKQTFAHLHTLHYGSDFLPFLEILPTLKDEDASWALKPDDISIESDDGEGLEPADAYFPPPPLSVEQDDEVDSFDPDRPLLVSLGSQSQAVKVAMPSTRERKSSLPLFARFLQTPISATLNERQRSQSSTRDVLSKLLKVAQQVLHTDSGDIAREMTRIDWKHFQKIKVTISPDNFNERLLIPLSLDIGYDIHWFLERRTLRLIPLHNSMNFSITCTIGTLSAASCTLPLFDHIEHRALSLILCHKKAEARACQMEKFAEVAIMLRSLKNYSSLRAIVTAISASSFPGDPSMEIFRTKGELYKRYLSYDVLFHSTGAHRSYRLALRDTKGGCIPCL